MAVIPFIDIFAGPGGLSEGFSRFASFENAQTGFESRLAIEKDPVAARTLELRSFYRAFPEAEVPDDYYQVIRGRKAAASLSLHPEWAKAEQHVWNVELGVEPAESLHRRIAAALDGARNWVLLGGPPCQAYSLMGRARMTGIGADARQAGLDLEELRQVKRHEFAADHRHKLYREYLRIVAVHQPAVFVMENVKGILSSRINVTGDNAGERVFEHIRRDLGNPWGALLGDPEYERLRTFRQEEPHLYHLHSLVVGPVREFPDRDFLIRSEDYGIPQKRHRVILLGIRDDLAAQPTSLRPSDAVTVKHAMGNFPNVRSGLSKGDVDWAGWVREIREAFKAHGGPLPGSKAVQEIICDFLYNADEELDRGAAFIPYELPRHNTELARWYEDARLGGIIQHEARSHMTTDLTRYLYAAAAAQVSGHSPKLEDWPIQLLPKHRNVRHDAVGKVTAEGFSDRFKVQIWGEASSTVTSHIAKDGHYFIHPDPMQCRSLTVREAARLQTFPDNYFFWGNRTQQYHQVGNAVPPYLACQIAEVVARVMEAAGLAGASDG